MWVCDTCLRKEEPAWAVLLCVHSKCPPDGWHVTARERVSWRGEMEDVLVVKVSCCFLIYLRLLLIRTFLDTPHLRGIVNTSLLHLGLSRLLFPSKFCIRIQKKKKRFLWAWVAFLLLRVGENRQVTTWFLWLEAIISKRWPRLRFGELLR